MASIAIEQLQGVARLGKECNAMSARNEMVSKFWLNVMFLQGATGSKHSGGRQYFMLS
jgi:hypothetical protein